MRYILYWNLQSAHTLVGSISFPVELDCFLRYWVLLVESCFADFGRWALILVGVVTFLKQIDCQGQMWFLMLLV